MVGKSHIDSQRLVVSETTLSKTGWRVKVFLEHVYF